MNVALKPSPIKLVQEMHSWMISLELSILPIGYSSTNDKLNVKQTHVKRLKFRSIFDGCAAAITCKTCNEKNSIL